MTASFIGNDLYRYPKYDLTSDRYNDLVTYHFSKKTPKDNMIAKLEN